MAKVSASTLVRRAANAPPKEAKRLRAKAAAMRREARKVRWVLAQVPPVSKHDRVAGQSAARAAQNRAAEATQPEPNHGPRYPDSPFGAATVGAQTGTQGGIYPIEAVERLRSAAKQKPKQENEADIFAIRLRSMLVDERIAGRREAETQANARAADQREANTIAAVSGFLARMYGIEKQTGRGLPPSLVVDGFTLARVCNALRDAGYTVNGKEGIKRHG